MRRKQRGNNKKAKQKRNKHIQLSNIICVVFSRSAFVLQTFSVNNTGCSLTLLASNETKTLSKSLKERRKKEIERKKNRESKRNRKRKRKVMKEQYLQGIPEVHYKRCDARQLPFAPMK